MQPSPRWFPTTLQDRAAWYQNFISKFGNIGVNLGILPAEVTTLTNDSAVMTALADAAVELDTYNAAVRQFSLYITEGSVGEPDPEFPQPPTISVTGTPTGMFERLDGVVKRIRVAPAYTPGIGALLGIIPVSPARPIPGEEPPAIKLESMPGNKLSITFKRGIADGIAVEARIDNEATWSELGLVVKSPGELKIAENPNGLPRAVQVRARYLEGNTPVGQYSAIIAATTQPAA